MLNMLTEDISSENYEKYNPPNNCEHINAMQVNNDIYKNASKSAKIKKQG